MKNVDQFKIDHFERENGRGTFPPFRRVNEEECRKLRTELASLLGLDSNAEPITLLRLLNQMAEPIEGVDADDNKFDLGLLFESLKLEAQNVVLLNWHRFNRIDEMRAPDLCKHFSNIWYPSSEDLDVIEPKMRWVLRIAHHGAVSVVRLQ